MQTDDFDYILPPELIAQKPVEPRDHSRLLVINRAGGQLEHSSFFRLGDYLNPGDLLVANESRVLPVRLHARKEPTGGKVEVLLLRPRVSPETATETGPTEWEALVSPGRRIHDGAILSFGQDGESSEARLTAEVVERGELGSRIVRFNTAPNPYLDELGEMPLPPYIHERLADRERYQTVYSRHEGSAAAPTAGLHFTEALINSLRSRGVGFATLTLHVGLDTFRPVHEANVDEHPMHREWYSLPGDTADAINETRAHGGRVVAVGTTSVRVLETVARAQQLVAGNTTGRLRRAEGWSDLFIRPGYKFALVDAMITNFHLPRTTLLMLVSAFAGLDLTLEAYNQAIAMNYRFYSFGDSMLIL